LAKATALQSRKRHLSRIGLLYVLQPRKGAQQHPLRLPLKSVQVWPHPRHSPTHQRLHWERPKSCVRTNGIDWREVTSECMTQNSKVVYHGSPRHHSAATRTAITLWVSHAIANPMLLARLYLAAFAKVHLVAVTTKPEAVVPATRIRASLT